MNKIEKLEHLKKIVLSVPENQINLDMWRNRQGLRLTTKDEMLKAGAQACVMGWATADPTFYNMGFKFHRFEPIYTPKESKSIQAVQDFFELTEEQASLINNRFSYESIQPSHDEIIQNINQVIDLIKQDESSIDAAPTSNIIFHAVHLSGVDFDIEAAINNAYLINCTCIDIERGAAEIYFKTLDTPATQAIEEFSKKHPSVVFTVSMKWANLDFLSKKQYKNGVLLSNTSVDFKNEVGQDTTGAILLEHINDDLIGYSEFHI